VAYRDLSTGDLKDSDILLDEDYPMVWAESKYGSALNTMHSSDGIFQVIIPSDGSPATHPTNIEVIQTKKGLNMWAKHGLIMGASWFLMGFVCVGTNRWFRE
jgi:hypothetical protein